MTPVAELHYFEVDLGDSAEELRSALFSGVHGFNTRNNDALGIDFSGTGMRVFGPQPALQAFFEQPRTQRLLAVCLRFTAPAFVPAATKAVSVLRHRPAGRQQPARLRRFAARNPDVALAPAKTIRCDLAVPLSSQSTGQEFLLKLARRPAAPSAAVRFNSYGLCAPGSSLPAF